MSKTRILQIDNYISLLANKNNPYFTEDLPLIKFKLALEEKITEDPIFRNYFRYLNETTKTKLIAALLSNDVESILSLLSYPLAEMKLDAPPALLERICEHSGPSKQLLNSTVMVLIREMLTLDQDDFSGLAVVRILQKAMNSISDLLFSTALKIELCIQIDPDVPTLINDYSYRELTQPLMKNRFSGDISEKDYLIILKKTQLDVSEFILLTMGLLQKICKDKEYVKTQLIAVYYSYLNLNYDRALVILDKMATDHQKDLSVQLYKAMQLKAKDLKKVEPARNYSRRFFETRLAQLYYWNGIDIKRFDKVSRKITGEKVTECYQIESAVLDSFLIKSEELFIKSSSLQEGSMSANRKLREKFLMRNDETKGLIGESIFSQNPGLMLSNQPQFSDETTSDPTRNRVVDKLRPSDEKKFTRKRELAVYAASLSGHAFYFIGMIEDYIKIYHDDPELQADINNYIKAFICVYMCVGYHGFHEVADVFNEPHIKEIFAEYHIVLDLSWSKDFFVQAGMDAQHYTKMLCLKKSLHNEFKEKKRSYGLRRSVVPQEHLFKEKLVHLNVKLMSAVREADEKSISEILSLNKEIDITEAYTFAEQEKQENILKLFKDYLTHQQQDRSSALEAIISGDIEKVNALIEKNIYGNWTELIFIAVSHGHIKIIDRLIDHQPNLLSQRDHNHQTLLHLATVGGHKHVVNYLLEKKINKSALNKKGETALHIAILNNNLAIVKILLSFKTNIFISDKSKNTPLHLAAYSNNLQMIDIFSKHNANFNYQSSIPSPLDIALEKKNWNMVVKMLPTSHGLSPSTLEILDKNIPHIDKALVSLSVKLSAENEKLIIHYLSEINQHISNTLETKVTIKNPALNKTSQKLIKDIISKPYLSTYSKFIQVDEILTTVPLPYRKKMILKIHALLLGLDLLAKLKIADTSIEDACHSFDFAVNHLTKDSHLGSAGVAIKDFFSINLSTEKLLTDMQKDIHEKWTMISEKKMDF